MKRNYYDHIFVNNKEYTKRPDQKMFTWRTWCKIQDIKYKSDVNKYKNIIVLIYTDNYKREGRRGLATLNKKINSCGHSIIRSYLGKGLA